MDCRRVEELIPLYVEGDLGPDDRLAVSSHLAGCSLCVRLATDYGQSQQWLRSTAQVDFDEAELYSLRAGVLEEIERRRLRPGFLELMSQALSARAVAFATVALLVLAGGLALYFYSARPGLGVNDAGPATADAPPESEKPADVTTPEDVKRTPEAIPKPPRRRRVIARSGAARNEPRTGSRPQPEQASLPGVERTSSALPAEAETDGLAGSPDTLRIEIQTSDPNIRIIWFAPKEPDSRQPRPTTQTEQEAL